MTVDPHAAAARAADRAFFGLELGEGETTGRAIAAPHVLTPDGRLYGGSALALSIAAMEAATQRRIVWATAQFAGVSSAGAELTVRVDVLAAGRRSTQAAVHVTDVSGPVCTALGATASPDDEGFRASFASMPAVDPPTDCPPFDFSGRGATVVGAPQRGYMLVCEFRAAPIPGDGPPRRGMWARTDGIATSRPACTAFVGDMLPMTISRLAGVDGAGVSLDNTLRAVGAAESEWVLLELRADGAAAGYGHGTGFVWAQDGTLLAVLSQSARMRPYDRWR